MDIQPYTPRSRPNLPGSEERYVPEELQRIASTLRQAIEAINTLLAANDDLNSGWTQYTATALAGVGTLAAANASVHYKQVGKSVFFRIRVNITSNGTGSGWIHIDDLPFTPIRDTAFCGYGNTAKVLTGIMYEGTTIAGWNTEAGGYPTGESLLSGVCEVA
jgi:hypothetical protein